MGASPTVAMTTDANGIASSSQSLVTSTTTSFQYTFPSTPSISAQRTTKFSNLVVLSGVSCDRPADWGAWSGTTSTAPISPDYIQGTTVCVVAEYEEQPQAFSIQANAYYNDTAGTPKTLPGIPVTLNWLRGNGEYASPLNSSTNIVFNRSFYPYTTTKMQVAFPLDRVIGSYAYIFKEWSAGAGG